MTGEQLLSMRMYFENGNTHESKFRKAQLKNLKTTILKYENEIYDALQQDLHKSREESWVTEIGMVISEINHAIAELDNWMEATSVSTNFINFGSSSRIVKEPMGVVLIIAPWNYPFLLLFSPLVGAMAAGNCVVLKPSEFAGATESVMQKIVEETFEGQYISYVKGDGAKVIPQMMQAFRFNHIFYTGSTAVGKIIYKLAAEKLIPVTLELGGKSPCVVEADANIKVAARRIAMSKFSNAGQMCIAPDYVLVHAGKKDELIKNLKECIQSFYGASAKDSYDYGRIINEKQFDRLASYLNDGVVVHGGKSDRANLFIEPTILTDISADANVMSDEIFGPILPVLSFDDSASALAVIKQHPDPLAFYIFTSSGSKEKEWMQSVPAGGTCVNNTALHFTNKKLPFGGRGYSGTGAYHGKFSFDVFSHSRSVLKSPTWLDPGVKYPPMKGKLKMLKWFIK